MGCSFQSPRDEPIANKNGKADSEESILLSDVEEYLRLANGLMGDSLWFEATVNFDSALVELKNLDSVENRSDEFIKRKSEIRKTIHRSLIRCSYFSSQLQIKVPWTLAWDEEMEDVSDSEIVAVDSLLHEMNLSRFGLPVSSPLHPRVAKAMAALLGPGRSYFTKWLSRKGRFEPLILSKLKERNLPKELFYLAMVESGFSPKAWSRASASGLWQFISTTGKRYGLTYNWWIDERRDPEKSTEAALSYLEDLYREFKDWHLAMAAYNCGEGCIRRRIRNDSTRNYWELSLPRETINYIPKILAAMIIGENFERYGFEVTPQAVLEYDTVRVKHCISFPVIAKAANSTESELKLLNPELRRWSTPPNNKEYLLRVPKGKGPIFAENYGKLDKTKLINWHKHRVEKGENLGRIASNYGVSVRALKNANSLKGNLIHIGQKLLIPIPSSKGRVKTTSSKKKVKINSNRRVSVYTIQNGDNLSGISQKFKIPLAQLMQANKLSNSSIIKKGQKLIIPQGGGRSKTEKRKRNGSLKTYKVKAGDNLWLVAKKLNVSVDELKEWNKLWSNKLRIGKILVYYAKKSSSRKSPLRSIYYTVQSGDNLWAIAQKYKTSVKTLRELNKGLPKVLKPGLKIKVR